MKESGAYKNNFSELALEQNTLDLTLKKIDQKKFNPGNKATFYKQQGLITHRFY